MSDIEYLTDAARYAVEYSDDRNTQCGAVLVCYEGKVYRAANWLPLGVRREDARLEAPEKYRWIEHAERAVIYKAAQSGCMVAGATLYAPWFACPDCARALIGAGVSRVVGMLSLRQATPARWENEIRTAETMLSEAGVGMKWLPDRLGVTIRFDGKEFDL